MSQLSITVTENGPLKVAGDEVSLRYCGEPVDVAAGQDLYLCRCGESQNAPFCDGSHKRTGFVAEPPRPPTLPVKVWEGRTLRTRFNPNTCMHVFHCQPLKELRERELAGDDDAATEIARVVMSCPSGALSYEARPEVDLPAPPASDQADLEVMEGGELRVQRAFTINAALREEQPDDRATLCRCGLSRSKPWCDGRHKAKPDFR